jgi:lysophospholipase L1-like esterase
MSNAARTILCYGDSNTWGFDPEGLGRFSIHERWPGVLRDRLGDGYHVIEEGLNGRTTVWDDPMADFRNGKSYLLPCLWSHAPIDLVLIMLGTNDLKGPLCRGAAAIAAGAGALVGLTQTSGAGPGDGAPRVLLMAPPPLGKITTLSELWGFGGSEAESRQMGRYFKQAAEWYDCDFLDTSEIIKSSDLDGIHFSSEEHLKLGTAVAERVRQIVDRGGRGDAR